MQTTLATLCLTIAFALSSAFAVARVQEPTRTIESLLAEAREAQSRRDFATAADLYRKSIELDRSVAELWANLGLVYHESGKSDEAIRSFKEAIRLNAVLFVPHLFLGIEYLGANHPEAALPFLEKAEKLKPDDVQAALSLGKAYTLLNRFDSAAETYLRATRLTPNDGNAWLSLGMAYLQQVESDARLMTSTFAHSPYAGLRMAETLADEGKLPEAENAYKSLLQSNSPPPCTHAELGITLLREKNAAEANQQFELEMKTGSHCGPATLGMAFAQLAEGHPEAALTGLTSVFAKDPDFLESSLPQFRDSVSADQARSLIDLLETQPHADQTSIQMESLLSETFDSKDVSTEWSVGQMGRHSAKRTPAPANAEALYSNGQYAQCAEALGPAQGTITVRQSRLLTSCSFYAGDFETTALAAQRLKSIATTRAEGLYWESKADQNLAIAATTRAGELDPNSPRIHLLLGDVFRQERQWDEAEIEYRKAIDLAPRSHAAQLSLAIVLFAKLKTDEAFQMDRQFLQEEPDDPEANLLAGEILVQGNHFAEAEPFLSRCRNLKPEFVPRLHILTGQVYAETGRIPEAISEYKSGLATDGDGSIHYRLARLYQKSGDKKAADEAFTESTRLRRQWDNRAHVVLGQSPTRLSD